MTSVVSHLHHHAQNRPDHLFCSFLDGGGKIVESYTFRQIDHASNYLAARLQESGKVTFNGPVLLVYQPGLDFIISFLACVKLGGLAVPVPPPDASGFIGGAAKLAHIVRDCGATVALTHCAYMRQLTLFAERSAAAAAYFTTGPLRDLDWVPTDAMAGQSATRVDERANPTLLLQYTSGSTQSPRGVMVTQANVSHNCEATLTHTPVGVSWLPHFHDMGLIGYYLFILIKGGQLYAFSGANFLKRPLLWLETISRFGGTISSAPNFAFDYCLREDKVPEAALSSLDLSSLRVLMNASEPVRSITYERFIDRFARCGLSPRASVVFYGLAENTLGVTGNGRVRLTINAGLIEQQRLRIEPPRDDGYNQRQLVSCGAPLEGIDMQIVDPYTRLALGEDAVGEIWVGGASKAAGYFGQEALNQEVFRARLAGGTDDEYLRTGDIGFLHDGELFICGRLKDVIIVGGRNFYPSDIEAAVEQASPKIRPGCVVAFAIDDGEREAIAVLAEADKANDLPDIGQVCREVAKFCQIEVALFAIVRHGAIVKTSSGKVARQECRRRWIAGTIDALVVREQTPLPPSGKLIEALLSRIEAFPDATLLELGIDSLTLVELSLYLEDALRMAPGGDDPASPLPIFDLRLLQTVTAKELCDAARRFDSGRRVPKSAPRKLGRRLQAIEQAELRRMRADTGLAADIRPAARQAGSDGPLLLTGATGFFGAFVLEALLRLTDRPIVTVVRATDRDHAKARDEAALRRAGLASGALLSQFDARVTALDGDVAQPRLGLAERDWRVLSEQVSAVYHCAAEVDYIRPYDSLRQSNVVGTAEIIRFCATAATKALHLTSTTFVFGFVARESCREDEGNDEIAGLNFGYPQSKWVAERLALDAGRRGLPVAIYRPSLITASLAGCYVRRDLTARILAYMIRHGLSTSALNQISFLPSDVCANNLVALSLLPAAAGSTFHLTADAYYTMEQVCRLIERDFGYPFRYVSLTQFIAHMNENCRKEDPLYPLMAFFNNNHHRIDAMRDKRYDNRNYRAERAQSAWTVAEPPLEETVAAIVRFLRRENLIAPPPHPAAARHAADLSAVSTL